MGKIKRLGGRVGEASRKKDNSCLSYRVSLGIMRINCLINLNSCCQTIQFRQIKVIRDLDLSNSKEDRLLKISHRHIHKIIHNNSKNN